MTFSEKTDVLMYPMTKEQIKAYVETGEPMDKAAQYSVMIYSDRDWYIPVIMEEIGCEEFDSEIPSCNEYIQKRLVEEKGQLSKPSDYIIIK